MGPDQAPETRILLWAKQKESGTLREIELKVARRAADVRRRGIEVNEKFMSEVAAGIKKECNEFSEGPTLLDSFLRISRDLRTQCDQNLAKITKVGSCELFWNQHFLPPVKDPDRLRQFGDLRIDRYRGKAVDEGTHSGCDLRAPDGEEVKCANDGEVVFAGCLGIYGNCVVVDHGLGLFSLYGHLGSIDVKSGKVTRGQRLGSVGRTGLTGASICTLPCFCRVF